jgi:hypothetical protein
VPAIVLAYHADDEIARWWTALGGAGAAVVVLVALVLWFVLPSDRAGSRWAAIVALGTAALTAAVLASGFLITIVLAPVGLVSGIASVSRRRRDATRRLAVAGFLAGALVFDVGAAGFGACAITDACFH